MNSQFFSFASKEITHLQYDIPLFTLKPGVSKSDRYSDENYIVSIVPSEKFDRPTIFDKDIWIYCLSQLRNGNKSREIDFSVYDYLLSTNKVAGGKQYSLVQKSLDRLANTTIFIENHKHRIIFKESFISINDDFSGIGHKHYLNLSLPDSVYQLAKTNKLFRISRKYFNIGKPLIRRLYDISLMYSENQIVSIDDLLFMSGSSLSKSEFKRSLKQIILNDELRIVNVEVKMLNNYISFNKLS